MIDRSDPPSASRSRVVGSCPVGHNTSSDSVHHGRFSKAAARDEYSWALGRRVSVIRRQAGTAPR